MGENKAYVGITGLTSVKEVKDICNEFSQAGYPAKSEMGNPRGNSTKTSHIPMLGFLVSYKTLNGQPTQNRRYPPVRELSELLKAANGPVLPMIHYNSKEMDTLSEQVAKLFNANSYEIFPTLYFGADEVLPVGSIYSRGLCQALQLNIAWPDIRQVAKIKEEFPKMQIVFQASEKAISGKTPPEVAQGIRDYGSLLSHVLIDPSGGRGLEFAVESSVALYSEVRDHCDNLSIGFAGGFTGENVAARVAEIGERIGNYRFCIDAEGGLRDNVTLEYGDDLLNIGKAKRYLQEAAKRFDL